MPGTELGAFPALAHLTLACDEATTVTPHSTGERRGAPGGHAFSEGPYQAPGRQLCIQLLASSARDGPQEDPGEVQITFFIFLGGPKLLQLEGDAKVKNTKIFCFCKLYKHTSE